MTIGISWEKNFQIIKMLINFRVHTDRLFQKSFYPMEFAFDFADASLYFDLFTFHFVEWLIAAMFGICAISTSRYQ